MDFDMEGEQNIFRKKIIGGFNRQDVVEYITKLAKERNDLQNAKNKAASDARALEAEVAALRTELGSVRKAVYDYKVESLANAGKALSELEDGIKQLKAEVEAASAGVSAELEAAAVTVAGMPKILIWAGAKIAELKSALDAEKDAAHKID